MNLVASPPGGMGLPQLVHVTKVSVAALSVIMGFLDDASVIAGVAYILYVRGFATLLFHFSANIEKGCFWE